jgi:hypothetical protein
MGNITAIPLVSSEITGIWSSYMGETLLINKLKYFSKRVEDTETKAIMQNTLNLSNQRIEALINIFNQEKLTIPEGFKEKDVNIDAPRLFTDAFYLPYMCYASRVAMQKYTMTLNQVARSDIRDYFLKCIYDYSDLFSKSSQLKLSKGVYIRAPRVEVPKKVQYIENESFIVDWFGEKRPLLTVEITHAFSICYATIIRKAFLIGFSQVCKDKKVRDYILRGINMATKQTSVLNSILTNENIPITFPSDSYVTDSTTAPFSEKSMMNKTMIMCSEKIISLGMALADVMRSDVQSTCKKFIDEILKYSKDGADIMIDNGWLEQPPQAIKHEDLVKI